MNMKNFQKIKIKRYISQGWRDWQKCKIYPIPIEDRALILSAFVEMEDNSIKNIANKLSYTVYIVNKIIDDRYRIKV